MSTAPDFVSFARDAGLIVNHIPADGKVHRYPTETKPRKRNGAALLTYDGLFGWCMDYSGGAEVLKWKANGDTPRPVIDHAAIERRKSEARRKVIRATLAARAFWGRCKPLRGGHQYLSSHALDMIGCDGLKIDAEGWLVVPAMLDGKLMSVQRIGPDGEKRFWPGASMKGASYLIDRKSATVSVIVEGLATGLAIFAAVPQVRVIVGFDCGNLGRVKIPRRGLVVVAADNDSSTEERTGKNPGLIAAREAAKKLGCGITYPEGIIGSDWCDMRIERLSILRLERPKARDSALRGAADAELAGAILKNAVFVK